jgi:hypothetical protein
MSAQSNVFDTGQLEFPGDGELGTHKFASWSIYE